VGSATSVRAFWLGGLQTPGLGIRDLHTLRDPRFSGMGCQRLEGAGRLVGLTRSHAGIDPAGPHLLCNPALARQLPHVTSPAPPALRPPLFGYTQVIYALHLFSVILGVLGAATIVGSFLLGLPSIVAVVMNYVRRSEVRGTWLESHFSWQIRTFWWTLFWSLLVIGISAPLMLLMIGFLTAPAGLFVLGVWVLYRVLRGWTTLRALQPVP